MKKLIIALITVASSFAFAGPKKGTSASFTRPYGLAGCGLGSIIVGKKGGQIFAATTNGTSWNQTFGISAGTLNCVDSPSAEVAGRMDQFILVNRSQVQGDIARGQGETIAAIGQYMGCSANTSQIGSALKSNYPTIFTSGAAANEVTDSIITTILSNPELAQSCQNLG